MQPRELASAVALAWRVNSVVDDVQQLLLGDDMYAYLPVPTAAAGVAQPNKMPSLKRLLMSPPSDSRTPRFCLGGVGANLNIPGKFQVYNKGSRQTWLAAVLLWLSASHISHHLGARAHDVYL